MVSGEVDASVVSARILRETRNALVTAQREREEAECNKVAFLEARPVMRNAPMGTLAVQAGVEVQPPKKYEPTIEADFYYRRARLGVVAVLVLVLFWAWLQQRRGAARGVA